MTQPAVRLYRDTTLMVHYAWISMKEYFVYIAIEMEKRVQKWSRAKKEALIGQHFGRLPELSRKRNFASAP